MQRQIIHGIPYFVDKSNNLYLWDTEQPAYSIGTYDPKSQSITFNPNHQEGLQGCLATWRSKQVPRSRKPASEAADTNSRSNGTNPDRAADEHSDSDL